jgi:hypothetical protein
MATEPVAAAKVFSASTLMFRTLWLFLAVCSADGATKVKRVKAGKNYENHEPVHIVVNKVG